MLKENHISAIDFCTCHDIEISFIRSLNDYGLIEISSEAGQLFIPADELPKLEKIVFMHYELNINLEGIETIHFMLERVLSMQEELASLKNRLRFYEQHLG
jgi:chaperone modulatory protein CbpM